ncbi:metallophosphatase family protein [Halobacillus litoralis]|uniref:metallophosphoesterase family protein n=1 Tax=Halobacillus litoralis TaxID=45668 RepID=UPI001CD53C28|nr:metallophosphoesterase family protein [Halobacillus litoralis]MCA0969214.1 metallophosphatase family protein [Halobacillus litoralis]
MSKIAIIADTHGNATALEAVLSDIETRGITRIFCLGDIIGKGPQGSKCIDLIQKTCERVIRGNWDVFIQSETDSDFLKWFQTRMTNEDFSYLKSLEFHIDLELNGELIRMFHASPRSEFERILPWHDIEKRLSMFDASDYTNSGDRTPDMVIYADIHTTFLQTYHSGILCNVGSVGNSLDLTSASYGILDGSSGTNSIQFVRVEYDREKELRIAKEMGLPDFEKYYNEIKYAKYRNA